MTVDLQKLLPLAIDAAQVASQLIASKWRGELNVERKPNATSLAAQVVTAVDRDAEALIREHLLPTMRLDELGYLGEETGCDGSRFSKQAFWCVDPIDGTLPFIEGTPGFATSIALVARDGTPLLGVVADPVTSTIWSAAKGLGARCDGRHLAPPEDTATFNVFADRSLKDHPYFEATVTALTEIASELRLGPLDIDFEAGAVMNAMKSLKSKSACYFKFRKPSGGGSLWDYAATACIFAELGLPATDLDGGPFDLNREDSTYMNHRGVLYASSIEIANAIRDFATLVERTQRE
jgi:fructose-1,6-bisphosphatase/inositol monophosphatase family enzyme